MKNVIELDWRGFKFEIGVGDEVFIESHNPYKVERIDVGMKQFKPEQSKYWYYFYDINTFKTLDLKFDKETKLKFELELKLIEKDKLDSDILKLNREVFRCKVDKKIRRGSVCKLFGEEFTIRNINVNMNNTINLNKSPMAIRLEDIEVVEY